AEYILHAPVSSLQYFVVFRATGKIIGVREKHAFRVLINAQVALHILVVIRFKSADNVGMCLQCPYSLARCPALQKYDLMVDNCTIDQLLQQAQWGHIRAQGIFTGPDLMPDTPQPGIDSQVKCTSDDTPLLKVFGKVG